MPFLPVDTAVYVICGPLIDDTDFKTRETAVAYNAAGMDVILLKSAISGVPTQTAITPTTAGANDWVALADGYYYLEITAAQNNVEGELSVAGFATGVLPWRSVTYTVVPVAVFNSLVVGADVLDTNVTQWVGVAVAAPGVSGTPKVDVSHWLSGALAAVSVTGVPEVDVTHVAGSTTNVSTMPTNVTTILADTDNIQTRLPAALVGGRMDSSIGAVAAGAITAAGFATDAINSTVLAANAVAEIVTGVLTTQMTEAYAADNVAPTLTQILFMIQQLLGDFSISGSTLTVRKIDGTTTAATFTHSGSPVSAITRAT